ncbi:hypothetical protein FRC09_001712 [Ceratobasidium sp. 395]|nr:hypothetical protein FRC09_001712 [Ceratobasidium sp. 395]
MHWLMYRLRLKLYQFSLNPTSSQLFNINSANPKPVRGKYRFVLCEPLLHETNPKIEVYEFDELPANKYTIISYVWEGVQGDLQDIFKVAKEVTSEQQGNGGGGAGPNIRVPGNPISIPILQAACHAAQLRKTELLWLDALCINMSDEADNTWQVQRMYEIYKKSKFCIVFPSGLWQLISLSEETSWINRGWTLQEAVAPSEVEVMFYWPHGTVKHAYPAANDLKREHFDITQVSSSKKRPGIAQDPGLFPLLDCAMAPLSSLLDCTISGSFSVYKPLEPSGQEKPVHVRVFGTGPTAERSIDYRLVLPNVAALAVILRHKDNADPTSYHHSIWKSAMMRSTKYPADRILSIMGFFGVTDLKPEDYYNDEKGHIKATIHLTRSILANKGRATWLGTALFSPPCPDISTFPSFPVVLSGTNTPVVAIPGVGYVPATQLLMNEYVDPRFNTLDFPEGIMTDDGDLCIGAHCMPVTSAPPEGDLPPKHFQDIDEKVWVECSGNDPGTEPTAYAVMLCYFQQYSPYALTTKKFGDSKVRGFVVEKRNDSTLVDQTYEPVYLKSYFELERPKVHAWRPGRPYKKLAIGRSTPENLSLNYLKARVDLLDKQGKI